MRYLIIQKTTFFISRPTGTPTNGKDKVKDKTKDKVKNKTEDKVKDKIKDKVNNKAFMELRTPLVPFRHVPLFSEEGRRGD